MKQTLILGNIITIDDKKPFAKVAIVNGGTFFPMSVTFKHRKRSV